MTKKFSIFLATLIIAICTLLLIFSPEPALANPNSPPRHGSQQPAAMIRKVMPLPEQVTKIRTAMGYSTILEFQGKPLNAVLGDQDAFKIEFVGNSITIKPLFPHARSNLFIFTEFERFNCELESGSAELVDYIVSFKRKEKPPDPLDAGEASKAEPLPKPDLHTRAVQRFREVRGFKLNVISTAQSSSNDLNRSVTLIEIELSSSIAPYSFSPQSLGIKQGNHYLPIESIYLDTLSLVPGASVVHGKIAVLNQDMTSKVPLAVVFAVSDPKRKSNTLRLEVIAEPKVKKPVIEKGKGDPFYGIIPLAPQKH
jgi:Conjugal transfer protein